MNPQGFNKIFSGQKGMALFITLALITVFLAVSLELNRRIRLGVLGAQALKTRAQLIETAQSGVSIARALLVKDAVKTRVDSVQEEWADPVYLKKVITALGYDNDALELKIHDEMGKIQVNALIKKYPGHEVNPDQEQIWENLLSLFISRDKSRDGQSIYEIINSLKDWLDSGDDNAVTGVLGGESGYYESLDPPYPCANRDIQDLDILFKIKGINRDFLKRTHTLETLLPGLKPSDIRLDAIFTVSGAGAGDKTKGGYAYPGKININTAPIPVIAALLPFGRQDLAAAVHEYRLARQDESGGFINDLTQKEWYAGVAGLTKKEKNELADKITYSSHVFSIESRAALNGKSIVLYCVISRFKEKSGHWSSRILRQRIE